MSDASVLDVRKPIGALFTVLGILLVGWGLMTRDDPGHRPTGIPIVPIWGAVLLLFGVAVLLLSRRAAPRQRPRDT